MKENEWETSIGAPAEISRYPKCGEWRFIGVENILEFYIATKDCEIHVVPKDSIRSRIRMSWTLAEFYADGGTTRFVDRLAASLGIDSSSIQVTAVYEGSVQIEFLIIDDGLSTPLTTIQNALNAAINDGTLMLGAPILDAEVAAGGSYTPSVQQTLEQFGLSETTTVTVSATPEAETNPTNPNLHANTGFVSNNNGKDGAIVTTVTETTEQAEDNQMTTIMWLIVGLGSIILIGAVVISAIYLCRRGKPTVVGVGAESFGRTLSGVNLPNGRISNMSMIEEGPNYKAEAFTTNQPINKQEAVENVWAPQPTADEVTVAARTALDKGKIDSSLALSARLGSPTEADPSPDLDEEVKRDELMPNLHEIERHAKQMNINVDALEKDAQSPGVAESASPDMLAVKKEPRKPTEKTTIAKYQKEVDKVSKLMKRMQTGQQ